MYSLKYINYQSETNVQNNKLTCRAVVSLFSQEELSKAKDNLKNFIANKISVSNNI